MMHQSKSHLRHEVLRQLCSEFYAWNQVIGADFFARRCQQHCELFFMSQARDELSAWSEWRLIVAETFQYAEGVTNSQLQGQPWALGRLSLAQEQAADSRKRKHDELNALDGLRRGETVELRRKVEQFDKFIVEDCPAFGMLLGDTTILKEF